jgi:hypothetical protein
MSNWMCESCGAVVGSGRRMAHAWAHIAQREPAPAYVPTTEQVDREET